MSDNLQKRAVEKAIKFLNAAGAIYTIDFGEEKFTNKKTRPDFKSIYEPAIEEAVKAGLSQVTIKVPDDMVLVNFRGGMASYLNSRFGGDSSITEIDDATHTVSALWAA